jgi:predicted RNA binding protein YcfA (HicA-like mRNA interferase family)
MDSLPVIKPREVINALLQGGFYLHHQIGSHARLIHKTRSDLKVTVPVHLKDIPKGSLRRIIRQADLTVEEFLQLLD